MGHRWIGRIVATLLISSFVGAGAALAKKASIDPPEGSLAAEIPFTGYEQNRVFVNLAAEGASRPFELMLDTGAQATVMTPRAAAELGVRYKRLKNSPYRRKTLLGKDLQFYIQGGSSELASASGWDFALFGGDQLYSWVFEIDFSSKLVRFYHSSDYKLPRKLSKKQKKELAERGEAVLRLKVTANRPFVEIGFNGEKSWVLLDTGNPFTATMSGKTARKHGIDVASLPEAFAIGTTASTAPIPLRLYEAKTMTLGPFELEQVPIFVAPHGMHNLGGSTDSTIGYDILRRFVLRFDYRSGRMWVKERKDMESKMTFLGFDYEQTRRAGAFLGNAGDAHRVIGVLPKSPAERIGLRAGDYLRPSSVPGGGQGLRRVIDAIVAGEEITVVRIKDGIEGEVALRPPVPTNEGPSD